MDFRTLTLNGQPLKRLVHQETGAVIFNALSYRVVKGLFSTKGNAYVDLGLSNNFVIKGKMAFFPIDSRGLVGFTAGRAAYLGSVRSDYNFQVEQQTLDLTDSRIVQDVEIKFHDTNVTLTVVGGSLTSSGRNVTSDTFNFPKGIGSDYDTNIYLVGNLILENADGTFIKELEPCVLEEDIVNGSIGNKGYWDITNDVFIPLNGSREFAYTENAIDGEWEQIYGIRAVGGAYINTMYYPKCNDNVDMEITTSPYTSSWQINGVRNYSGTALYAISQTSLTADVGTGIEFRVMRNNGTNYQLNVEVAENTKVRIYADDNNMYIGDASYESTNRGTNECQLPFMLHAVNDSGNNVNSSNHVLHYFKSDAKAGDNLVDFIPVKIKATGEVLWLERLTMTYFRNFNTTGNFEEVLDPTI